MKVTQKLKKFSYTRWIPENSEGRVITDVRRKRRRRRKMRVMGRGKGEKESERGRKG